MPSMTLLGKCFSLDASLDEDGLQGSMKASSMSLGTRLDQSNLSLDSDSGLFASTLRSVGPVFTMSCSGFSSTSCSMEVEDLARDMASRLADLADERHVWFKDSAKEELQLTTPYAEVYGVHPRYFTFGRGGSMMLTPVAAMLTSKGLHRALRGRTRSASPCKGDREPLEEGQVACSLPDLPGDLAAHLAGDPCRALEVYAEMAGKREHFEKSSNLLQQRITKVNGLGQELQTLREAGRLVKSKLAEDAEGDRTLMASDLSCVQELDQLREKFQNTLPQFWQAEAEMDELEVQLQADATKMQKDFKSWHSQLRKRARRAGGA